LGFIDLSNVFQHYDTKLLYLAPWDNHPNELGHRIIADKLFYEITRHHAFIVK